MKKIFVFITLLFPFILSSQNLNVSGIQEGVWNYDTIFVVGDMLLPSSPVPSAFAAQSPSKP